MALIECPECKENISDKTTKCPKCGYIVNKPRRGFFGFIFKWSFIIFNIIMILWAISGGGIISDGVSNATNDAEVVGASIGGALGMGMIFALWLMGNIVLGLFVLFTRPKSN